VLGLAVAALATSSAQAAGFDEATGLVSLDGAALAIDFESEGRVPVTVYDTGAHPLTPVLADDGEFAIEGRRSLRVEGEARLVAIELDPIREGLRGRRIELRFWQRPLGTRLTGDLRWEVGDVDVGALTVQPTGAVTVDGWEEWTTGPVDFELGATSPEYLLLYDQQYFTSFGRLDRTLSVALDAVTLLDLGPARVAPVACRLTTEAEQCGELGVCTLGRCADAAAVLGGPLYEPRLRADGLARRAHEARIFQGSRASRALAGGFGQLLEGLQAASVRDYWTGLALAYDALSDGHARPPRAGERSPLEGGGCAYESDADLLPDRPVLPMIFELTPEHPLGTRVRPGDVIRTIDGLPPRTWMHRAHRVLSYAGDPSARAVQLTPQLLRAALLTGAVLELERCPRVVTSSTAALTACTPAEVEHVRVDLAELAASAEPAALTRALTCDFRLRGPLRHDRTGRRYEYAGFVDRDGARELQINGLPADGRWLEVVDLALDAPLPRVLVDQRLGTGGYTGALELLMGRLLAPADLARAELWPPLGVPESTALRAALSTCVAPACAQVLALDFGIAGRGRAAEARLAILDGYDISANDFVAELALRRAAPTRIFGTSVTVGSFGLVTSLPRLPGDVASPRMQTHDVVFLGPGEDHFGFRGGRGTVPHQVVRQRQSDLLRGVDTLLEAARAWLRGDT
jgi:hypothetical protein